MFALSDEELGETNLVEHEIKLTDNTTIMTLPRRLPYALRTELEEELEGLLNTGCIEPSTSPYSSGLVLVRKKDGSLRVCIDYRALNSSRPIPHATYQSPDRHCGKVPKKVLHFIRLDERIPPSQNG